MGAMIVDFEIRQTLFLSQLLHLLAVLILVKPLILSEPQMPHL